ncbi:unnamed protein product [Plutella xylostella]|uniref:Dr1-associated corepressor n=1 Tax=Plutella xylostella TaxID=51655 RepID=A0A8S4EKJ7_PLUXY|nr:unnamed protein product [Plutella xylostella]
MPSKKRKYNARFPAGRIKKIMQTDEEVGKVAQAVPIIISRTLELFVQSLLGKAMQVTLSRNAKTLSPAHVKQCILAEQRFDFLHDLVKNIPDVSAAEEKEMMSAESSPNSSRFSDASVAPRRIAREDSNSSSSSDVKLQTILNSRDKLGSDIEPGTSTSTIISLEAAMDLTKKDLESLPVRTANFYQETLVDEPRSVITLNPTYSTTQPSTSSYTILNPVELEQRVTIPVPKTPDVKIHNLTLMSLNNNVSAPNTPVNPIAPILNIDFSKNLAVPEIKVLDSNVANIVGVKEASKKPLSRQNSKAKIDGKKVEKPSTSSVNLDFVGPGNLQIDEDYDT